MKRYRVLAFDFDSRANVISTEVKESWDETVKAQWVKNKAEVKAGLVYEYGEFANEHKMKNFADLGHLPLSVIAFHNKFLRQARDAFVIGAHYPALTATCALGERILNQLILHLRDDFKKTKEYKKVYNKDSFDNWDLAINTLESWGVLLPKVVKYFKELKSIRNTAIHFNSETDDNDRGIALEALKKMTDIIQGQFAGFGTQPWYIPKTKGICVVKKEAETIPFVKRIILPSCFSVGYKHELEHKDGKWILHDNHDYTGDGFTDEEYIKIYEEYTAERLKQLSESKTDSSNKKEDS